MGITYEPGLQEHQKSAYNVNMELLKLRRRIEAYHLSLLVRHDDRDAR
jgi:hypothetical protein